MTKSELRKAYLERRALLSLADTAEASRLIAANFFRTVGLAGVRYLHTFIRIPRFNEVDTSMIYYRVWRDHPAVVTLAPRFGLDDGLENIAFGAETKWVDGRFGVREPSGGLLVRAELIDVCIVPLLAFDTTGHRVGYGKGIYDSLLSTCRPDCLKVGLSYFLPEPSIPEVRQDDVRLNICITPEKVYRFEK